MARKLASTGGTEAGSPTALGTKPFTHPPKSDDMASSMPSMLTLSKPPT